MPQPERDTYLTGEQLLERAIAYAADIAEQLDGARARKPNPRVALLLDTFAAQQHSLEQTLEEYADDAPTPVLETYAQYAIALPDPAADPPPTGNSDDLTRWLLERNDRLVALFAEIAEDAESAIEFEEAFESLATMVRSHNQRISKEANRMQDL